MAIFDGMNTASSGMTAHRLWMDLISSNLANADATRSANGGPFRRQIAVFAESGAGGGVAVEQVRSDPSPLKQVYDPGHPDADANGVVQYPNVDPAREMVDMLNASRAFEASAVAMTTSKNMLLRALEIGQR
ncbi:MAG: flagellar basal body rod protein FlgC [Fimbriimonadaceae bacterium]|nr:flagellar basal body rod protein FlgC [Fimbriimonadaceae bacterium]